jgi:hypothetical protein
MDDYFNYLQQVWDSAEDGYWFDGLFEIYEQARRYPPEVRKHMHELLTNAEQTAMGDAVILRRIQAVAGPLELAGAFAAEYDIIQRLLAPPTNMKTLREAEDDLGRLREAIEKRRKLVRNLGRYEWGADALRALNAGNIEPTLKRWDRKETELIEQTESLIRILENAIR